MYRVAFFIGIFLLYVTGSAAADFDPLSDPNLIGWWQCDEGQGSTVADSSANGNDGTFVNGDPAWTTGFRGEGTGIRLVGPTLVEVPAMGLTLTEATMAGWFLPNGSQPDWASLIMHRATGGAHGFNFLADGRLAYHWNNDQASWSYRGDAFYAADEWTHCALTVEPDKATFYVNGVEQSVNSIAHAPATWDGPVWFGGDGTSDFVGRRMDGALDEVMFFSRALDAAEIKALVPPRLKAYKPTPADGTQGILTPLLQWQPGETALFHNVYFGTTPELTEDDLVAPQYFANIYFYQAGLQAGTTYYWRVDEIEADQDVIEGDVWSFTAQPLTAFLPEPANDATGVTPGLILEWAAGKGVPTSYQVYFGMDQTAVAAGDASVDQGQVTDPEFDTGALRAYTTYYWRVDQTNLDGSTAEGEVWSFTTFPGGPANKIVYEVWEGISGTAIGNLVNNEDYPDNPTTQEFVDEMASAVNWADNYGQRFWGWLVPPETGEYTFWISGDDNQQLLLSTDASPTNTEQIASVSGWTNAEEWDKFPTQESDPIALEAGQKYFIMALGKEGGGGDSTSVAWQGPGIDAQAIISAEYVDAFGLPPLTAFGPTPVDGAVETRQDLVLTWNAGEGAEQHAVYLGTDPDAVSSADQTSPVFMGTQNGTSFDTGPLEWGVTYSWRVDEISGDDVIVGHVWSFTTADYLPVEDFESYDAMQDEGGNAVFLTWIDGFGDDTNGSLVGYLDPANGTFNETSDVHSGGQAMPFEYNNVTANFSEATREFDAAQNWTVEDLSDLTIWYKGAPVDFAETDTGITMSASGADIWDMSDEFRYAYDRVTGDVTVTTRVDSLVDTDPWAKAGVMIRETLEPNSKHAYVVATPGNGVSFGWRQFTADTSGSSTVGGIETPVWVKLTRSGDTFTAQYSTDGATWEDFVDADGVPVATEITMTSTVNAGLALTSHDAGATTTAEFSEIDIDGSTPSFQVAEVGVEHPGNQPDQLYVIVEDTAGGSATVEHPEGASAVNVTDWTSWKVPLADLAGVNLSRVGSLTLGVGNANMDGAGMLLFDDIRVTKPEPVVDPNAAVVE